MQIFVAFARFPCHFLIGSNNHFACLSQHTKKIRWGRSFFVNSNDPFLIVFLAYFLTISNASVHFSSLRKRTLARFTRWCTSQCSIVHIWWHGVWKSQKKSHFTFVDEFLCTVERSLKVFGKSYSGVKWIYGLKIMPCPDSFNPAPHIALSLTLRWY